MPDYWATPAHLWEKRVNAFYSSNLLAETVAVEERAIAQGANDTVIAFAATLCAFVSGAIVIGYGWTILALAALPLLVIAMFLPRRSYQ